VATKIDICNKALTIVKTKSRINDFDNQTGLIPDLMRTYYPDAVRSSLADFSYSFATKVIQPVQAVGVTIPHPYTYAFRLPGDYLHPAGRLETCSWTVGADETSQLIYTTGDNFKFSYVRDISEEPHLFPIYFRMGVEYMLASLIAPDMEGVKSRNAKETIQLYMTLSARYLSKARAMDTRLRGSRRNEDEWL
jgi:hypothetical protein